MIPARTLTWALGLALLLYTACTGPPRYVSGGARGRGRVTAPKPLSTTNSRFRKGTVLSGIASFYGPDFHGKLTANGEVYDMYGTTAAHKTLPFNTIVRVTNIANGKRLIVRINDRGPYVKGRMLDLSYGAALKLGFVGDGTTRVKVQIIEVGDNKYMKHLPGTP